MGEIRTYKTVGKARRAKVRRTAISFSVVVSRVMELLKLYRAWKPVLPTDLRHANCGRPLQNVLCVASHAALSLADYKSSLDSKSHLGNLGGKGVWEM